MINYETNQIRNVAFLGHRGSGKTSLIESLLYSSGNIKKQGSIEKGTTISDFDKEEIKNQFSINCSVIPMEYKGHKYNILDTPGYFDFIGEVYSATRVAGAAIIVLDATEGIQVGTEKAWEILEENEIPRFIYLNKMDKDIKKYDILLQELKDKFGKKIAPFCIPIIENGEFKGFVNVIDKIGRIYDGKQCIDIEIPSNIQIDDVRNMLLEAVAEVDEVYLEKYFNGIELTHDEIKDGLRKGVLNGSLIPVLMGSSISNIGSLTLFDMMYNYMPTPSEMQNGERVGKDLNLSKEMVRKVKNEEDFSAIVFKSFVDPFLGKISVFKVNSGVIRRDSEILNSTRNKKEKIANLMFIKGNNQVNTEEVRAGDIGITTKLIHTQTGDTLCSKENPIIFPEIKIPKPCIFYSIEPKEKSDDEKLSLSLQKICEEDPSIVLERSKETKELLLGCQGEKQLSIAMSRVENKFGVHALVKEPKVAYKETFKLPVTVQGKHKKQSGGAGQFGDVHIKFEPIIDGFEFSEKLHGASVPRNYVPAVEKGIVEASEKGVVAGYPVINFRAVLIDGSYHPVDSNDLSFKMAGMIAFRKAMEIANPVLLEPVMKMSIEIPEEYVGDIMGDLNKRRGKILGIVSNKIGRQTVIAEVPHNEILTYALDLRSMTQGRGFFSFEFSNYCHFYGSHADKIIKEYRSKREEN